MQELKEFLHKHKNIAVEKLKEREIICNAIEKITKQKLDLMDIQIIKGTVSVKADSAFKSEIFLKKKMILDYIKKNFTNKHIKDIR